MKRGFPPERDGTGRWAAVLFDLDGTLADTIALILACYRHTMVTHLGEAPPDQRWLGTVGTRLTEQLLEFARSEAEHRAMLETYRSFQRAQAEDGLRAYPGARRVALRLKENGAALAVVTSKGREMARRTLARCRLDDLFPVVVAAEDVAAAKPDPEPVLRAMYALGVAGRPREVLFVGDSPFDVTAGNRAGVRTAAALWGPFGRAELEAAAPHHFVRRLRDVLALVPDGSGTEGSTGGPRGRETG